VVLYIILNLSSNKHYVDGYIVQSVATLHRIINEIKCYQTE